MYKNQLMLVLANSVSGLENNPLTTSPNSPSL